MDRHRGRRPATLQSHCGRAFPTAGRSSSGRASLGTSSAPPRCCSFETPSRYLPGMRVPTWVTKQFAAPRDDLRDLPLHGSRPPRVPGRVCGSASATARCGEEACRDAQAHTHGIRFGRRAAESGARRNHRRNRAAPRPLQRRRMRLRKEPHEETHQCSGPGAR